MSFKSEFTEVYNYLSNCCADLRIITSEASEDDFVWKDKDSSTGVIIKYKGKDSVVKVPEGVVEIGSRDKVGKDGKYDPDGDFGCFEEYKEVTHIILPKSLKKIGKYAFYECKNLSKINIPASVMSIGDDAFYKCNNLTSIDIPNGVISIGEDAFYQCTNLVSINIPNSVTSIGSNAFLKSGLTSIICSKKLDLSQASVPDGCSVIRR